MGLETGTYISDLVVTNPVNSDLESQGAAHLRLIKSVLKNTFPNASRAFPITVATTKTINYTVQATDAEGIICVDTTAGAVTLTLPTLASGDAGWTLEAVKINAGTNPYFIAPASGTLRSGEITGLSSTRRSIVGRKTKVIWTGSLWICDRVVGPPVGSIIPCFTGSLVIGYEWPNGQTLVNAASAYPDYNSVVGSGATVDLRQRAIFGTDLGGAASGRITVAGGNFDGTIVGGAGGAQNHTLATAELPVHNHPVFLNDPGHVHGLPTLLIPQSSVQQGATGGLQFNVAAPNTSSNTTGITVRDTAGGGGTANQTATTGSGAAHSILPPAMTLPYLLVVE